MFAVTTNSENYFQDQPQIQPYSDRTNASYSILIYLNAMVDYMLNTNYNRLWYVFFWLEYIYSLHPSTYIFPVHIHQYLRLKPEQILVWHYLALKNHFTKCYRDKSYIFSPLICKRSLVVTLLTLRHKFSHQYGKEKLESSLIFLLIFIWLI